MSQKQPHLQTPAEEVLNCITHGIGAALSLIALAVLVTLASLHGSARHVITFSVYGLSLLALYLASTLYHGCRDGRTKRWLQVLDHIAIYVLIAGTYTPFLLVSIRGGWGWSLFGVLWGLAIAGAIFKLFFGDRFDFVSTLVYVAMGWIGLIGLQPFLEHLPGGAVRWIFAGGVTYTAGVAFYLWDRLPYNHAIWHLFVLGGSACHFLAVVLYVLPT